MRSLRVSPLVAATIVACGSHAARAQIPAGTYVLSTSKGDSLTLTFDKDSAGITRGHLTGVGTDMSLTGRRRAGGLAGSTTSSQGPGYFSAALRNGELDLVLADVNPNGSPRFDTAHQYVFFRKGPPIDSITRVRSPH